MAKRELTLEVVNPDVLMSDAALTVMAELVMQFAADHGLFDKGVIQYEQKTKVLNLRPRSDREKFRQDLGRKSKENGDCLQGRQELLRIQDA